MTTIVSAQLLARWAGTGSAVRPADIVRAQGLPELAGATEFPAGTVQAWNPSRGTGRTVHLAGTWPPAAAAIKAANVVLAHLLGRQTGLAPTRPTVDLAGTIGAPVQAGQARHAVDLAGTRPTIQPAGVVIACLAGWRASLALALAGRLAGAIQATRQPLWAGKRLAVGAAAPVHAQTAARRTGLARATAWGRALIAALAQNRSLAALADIGGGEFAGKHGQAVHAGA